MTSGIHIKSFMTLGSQHQATDWIKVNVLSRLFSNQSSCDVTQAVTIEDSENNYREEILGLCVYYPQARTKSVYMQITRG